MFNVMENHDLVYLNDPNLPTFHRVNSGYTNLLDFAFTTTQIAKTATDCMVGECVGSDHLPVVLRLNNHNNIKNFPIRKTRLVGKTNWQKYTTEILNHIPNDMEPQNKNINTIDSQIHDIEKVMISAFHKSCPEKPMRPLASTLNKETVALIKRKRKLRRVCQRNQQDTELKTAYYSLKTSSQSYKTR